MDNEQLISSQSAEAQETNLQQESGAANKKGVTGSTVKIIAVTAMLIDHISAVVITRYLLANGYAEAISSGNESLYIQWMEKYGTMFWIMFAMRMIGRLGFPIFCFLLVEGFRKTRNVRKYAIRLGIFALISEIPFNLAVRGSVSALDYQNVYFTLLFGLLALWGIDTIRKLDTEKATNLTKAACSVGGIGLVLGYLACIALFGLGNLDIITALIAWTLAVVCISIESAKKGNALWQIFASFGVTAAMMLAADFCKTDYSGCGVLTIVLIYYLFDHKVRSMLHGNIMLTIMSLSEITAFFTLIPIAMYNGKRGLKMKYFFYAFYPAHLLILWAIAALMGMGFISAV